MVGRLMQHSETVGEALHILVESLSVQDRVVVPSLTTTDGIALFSISVYQPAAESADQISDGALAVTVNALRSLCGSDWRPAEVLVPRAAPATHDPYLRHFRAPVRFNQESATLVFPDRDLERRVAGADPMMRALLAERIGHLKGHPGCEFSDEVRRLLRTRLMSHHCSADDTAELLAMHRRTLSRHLKSDGMGYRAITNEIRFEIARQLLQDTTVPLAQIAAALGYSEASAFTRAFRRWSGQTPTAWRTAGHHE
ncbi:MAG: AraC family transcriptional regulator [Microvirga sp.]|jgi:AraC-like DNA-binding protein|nr:AraC family transcriptional regulator [Microvirga sp.]